MLSLKLSKVFPHPKMKSLAVNCPVSSRQFFSISKTSVLQSFSPRLPSHIPFFAAAHVVEEAELRREQMPKHIGVIMDGNGRWAKSRGLQVQFGHKAGMVAQKKLAINCCEFGIKVVTVFVFSTENWKRSQMEVDLFMRIIERFIRLDVMDLIKRYNIRFSVIGDISRLPKSLQLAISSAKEGSHANKGMHFILALNYGGRYEITEACRKIATEVKDGVLRVDDVNESLLDQRMMTNIISAFPNPDLMIRTSGELRVSNFLLWELAYAEFYFASKWFPDFERADLIEALASFQCRKRRFGERPN